MLFNQNSLFFRLGLYAKRKRMDESDGEVKLNVQVITYLL